MAGGAPRHDALHPPARGRDVRPPARAATVSRVALVVFAIVYAAFVFIISAPGIAIHVTPFGPAGLALFIVALVLVMRTAAAPSGPVRPMIGQPGAA